MTQKVIYLESTSLFPENYITHMDGGLPLLTKIIRVGLMKLQLKENIDSGPNLKLFRILSLPYPITSG